MWNNYTNALYYNISAVMYIFNYIEYLHSGYTIYCKVTTYNLKY